MQPELKLRTVGEILGDNLEAVVAAWCARPPRTRWGRWRLTPDHKALEFELREPAGQVYYVPLSDCRTRDGALLLITHMADKRWITDADLGCFVRALIDLHGLLERIEEEE
jgi:hypothetical protein